MPRTLILTLLCLSVALPAVTAAEPVFRIQLLDAKGGPIQDAVASLIPREGQPPATPAAPVEIAQEDQEYVPYVTVLQVGTQVDFPNNDTIQHHLYSVSKAKRFEKPLYASGARESVIFDQPGVVTLGCNIHDWMVAYVVVLETPFFAKSDASGAAVVRHGGPGAYRLEVWHPRLNKPLTQEVVLAASQDKPLTLTLTLKPDRRIRRAPDGKAGGY